MIERKPPPDTHRSHPAFIDVVYAERLVVAVQSGDAGALDELVERCCPLIRAIALRAGVRHVDADDVVQFVCEQMIVHVGRLREPAALVGWVVVVARRHAASVLRQSSRAQPSEHAEDVSVAGFEDDAVDIACRPNTVRVIRAAVERLPDREQRLVHLMFDGTQRSYRELSDDLEIPVGSIGPTRARVLSKLLADSSVRNLHTA